MRIFPPPDSAPLATTDGRVDEFWRYFTELRSRWVKVERLQHYDESDSPGYQSFLRGDYDEARRLVQQMVREQDDPFFDFAREHGISMIRIRICDLPLGPYLVHYEIPGYVTVAERGPQIRFVDAEDISDLLASTGISDYVLFDETRVIARLYHDDDRGILREAHLVEDTPLVGEYVKVTEELIERSVPMHDSPIFQSVEPPHPSARR